MDTKHIDLENPSVELFDQQALQWAEQLARENNSSRGKINNSTQLRRFYDELCRWHDRVMTRPVEQQAAELDLCLPLVRMLNAKVAYARGRELVDQQFCDLMRACVRQINTPRSLNHFKLFFEAILGFMKPLASK